MDGNSADRPFAPADFGRAAFQRRSMHDCVAPLLAFCRQGAMDSSKDKPEVPVIRSNGFVVNLAAQDARMLIHEPRPFQSLLR